MVSHTGYSLSRLKYTLKVILIFYFKVSGQDSTGKLIRPKRVNRKWTIDWDNPALFKETEEKNLFNDDSISEETSESTTNMLLRNEFKKLFEIEAGKPTIYI